MTIHLNIPDLKELKPRITVIGVGGAGGNAVNNMIESKLEGVEFVVANTDAQALTMSSAERRVQMGTSLTEGLGAGSHPEVGRAAAEEALPEIVDHLTGSHMVFITAGMGGGTGTGAAAVIAKASRELGILTVGVVTKPFQFEGKRRLEIAEDGISELEKFVDTLLVIPNQNLFRIANEKTTFSEAFAMADEVLHSGVAGITDLMTKEGLINLDFADVRVIISKMGKAMMGTGEAEGEKRAIEAAEMAISNPLLDDVSMRGASGLLISISGGSDLTLYEVDEAASRIREEVDPDANVILGATFDDKLDGKMRVSVVATGIEREEQSGYISEEEREGVLRDSIERHRAGLLEDQGISATTTISGLGFSPVIEETQQPVVEETINTEELVREAHGLDEVATSESGPVWMKRKNEDAGEISPIPEITDFPEIAQKEYAASETESEPAGIESEKKRVGFFERLASVGLGKKEAVTKPVRTEPSMGSEFTAVAAPANDAEQTIETVSEFDETEDESLEIPAFLRRQAN